MLLRHLGSHLLSLSLSTESTGGANDKVGKASSTHIEVDSLAAVDERPSQRARACSSVLHELQVLPDERRCRDVTRVTRRRHAVVAMGRVRPQSAKESRSTSMATPTGDTVAPRGHDEVVLGEDSQRRAQGSGADAMMFLRARSFEYEDEEDSDDVGADEEDIHRMVAAEPTDTDDYDNFVVEDEASGASDFDNYGESVMSIREMMRGEGGAFSGRTPGAGQSNGESGDSDCDDADEEYGGGPNRRRRLAAFLDERSNTPSVFNDRRAVYAGVPAGGAASSSSGDPSTPLTRTRRVFRVERTEFSGGHHRPCFTFHGLVVEGSTEQQQQQQQRILEDGLTLSVRYEPPSPKFHHKCPSSASYRLKVARGKDFLYSTRGMERSLYVDYTAQHAIWGDLELHFTQKADLKRFMLGLKHVRQEDVTGKGILLGPGADPIQFSGSDRSAVATDTDAGMSSWQEWITSTVEVSRDSFTGSSLMYASLGVGLLAVAATYASLAVRRR